MQHIVQDRHVSCRMSHPSSKILHTIRKIPALWHLSELWRWQYLRKKTRNAKFWIFNYVAMHRTNTQTSTLAPKQKKQANDDASLCPGGHTHLLAVWRRCLSTSPWCQTTPPKVPALPGDTSGLLDWCCKCWILHIHWWCLDSCWWPAGAYLGAQERCSACVSEKPKTAKIFAVFGFWSLKKQCQVSNPNFLPSEDV